LVPAAIPPAARKRTNWSDSNRRIILIIAYVPGARAA
jgi:hypothetical protein